MNEQTGWNDPSVNLLVDEWCDLCRRSHATQTLRGFLGASHTQIRNGKTRARLDEPWFT